jgi:hypothetical protein
MIAMDIGEDWNYVQMVLESDVVKVAIESAI